MGAVRRFLAPVAALALALVLVPQAAGATGDLTVSVGTLTAPSRITVGQSVPFSVRYTVRGPAAKRASATVVLVLADRRNRYRITSLAATVRPAIWVWRVTDTLPATLDRGSYTVTATVRLLRDKVLVSSAKRSTKVTVLSTRG